jgi:hypothetical protein
MVLPSDDPADIKLVQDRRHQIELWTRDIGRLADRQFSFADLTTHCIELPPPGDAKPWPGCRVEEFGKIDGQSNMRYQLYDLPNHGELPSEQPRAVAIFTNEGGDAGYRLAAWATGPMNPPTLTSSPIGTLMIIPETPQGMGGWAYDKVYLNEGPEHIWRELDAMHWVREFERMLPEGLRLQVPTINYRAMATAMKLQRDSDPNCCPTGGRALVSLKLVDRRLAVESWRWLPSGL